nr:hypothetical protein CQW23_16846 [Ipomoea trifida]GLL21587.1 hypothetical protein CQW23_16846 [Ipomoea trifida]
MNSKIVGSPDSAYANEEVGAIFSPGPDSIATIPLHEVSLHLDIESPFLAALPETEESPSPESVKAQLFRTSRETESILEGFILCPPSPYQSSYFITSTFPLLWQLLSLRGLQRLNRMLECIRGILLNRRNIPIMSMPIESMLLAVNSNFLVFSVSSDDMMGQSFASLVPTVAAAESAIGLAIFVITFRVRGTIAVESINSIQGSGPFSLGERIRF